MNKELAKSIGTAARQARKALQLTQEDAAERIDVSVEFYARIERGTSLPSILTFARIVTALGVSADALLGRQTTSVVQHGASWAPPPPNDSPEIRRLMRRLRKAQPGTVRLVNLLLKEIETQATADEQDSTESESADDSIVPATKALTEEPVFHGMRPVNNELSLIAAVPVAVAAGE